MCAGGWSCPPWSGAEDRKRACVPALRPPPRLPPLPPPPGWGRPPSGRIPPACPPWRPRSSGGWPWKFRRRQSLCRTARPTFCPSPCRATRARWWSASSATGGCISPPDQPVTGESPAMSLPPSSCPSRCWTAPCGWASPTTPPGRMWTPWLRGWRRQRRRCLPPCRKAEAARKK